MNARVEELFHELVDLSPAARTEYFAGHPVDEQTRRDVEVLLAFDPSASSALMRDISDAASRALPRLELSEFAANGHRCGPYRLLEVIGRGGMGAVYLAERADGEVQQRVAVKLLPRGAGDPQRERFLQERQILASLTHPNIARLLDAGHIENGQPFLAMEYVDGQPIDVFAGGLSLRQKIALFLKICAAVGYLHRNLVVHRDLKPGNILVTAEGEPKLLDFGIAKILGLATDSTLTSMRMMTPDYASPEQAAGARVSTAMDIYSLGAVLYRLLTDKPPHEFEDTSLAAITTAIATREVTRPSRWAPELKGDLESILMKALRKEPRERYATVEQFAEDLQAWVESRPVRARSGNAWYRTRKWVRRYWLPVGAALLVIASLSAGLYLANRQRVIAERRFGQLHELSTKLIDLEPDLGTVDPELGHKLVALSIQYLEGLGGDALHDKQLSLEIGNAYLRVARLQGVPAWNHQGQYDEAERSLSKADLFADSVLRADPRNRDALWILANAAYDRAIIAYAQRKPERVLAYSPKAVEGFDRLARLGNLTRREINAATYIFAGLADVHIALHRFDDAVHYARLGIEYSRNTPGIPGPRAQCFNTLAVALMDSGDVPGALSAMQEARRQMEQVRREDRHPRYIAAILGEVRSREGIILGDEESVGLNRPLEAAAALQEAFDALEDLAQKNAKDAEDRSDQALDGWHLGNILRRTDPRRAFEVYEHALVRIREVPNDVAARRTEALLLAGSSYAARRLHREDDARTRIDTAFRLLRETRDYPTETIRPGSEADVVVRALADDYAGTGRFAQAVDTYQELYRRIVASNPGPESDLVNAAHISRLYASLAALLRRVGRKDEAAALEKNRAGLWQHWRRKLPDNPFVLRQTLAATSL